MAGMHKPYSSVVQSYEGEEGDRSNPSPPGGRKGALNDSILDVILGVILSHLGGHLEAILEAVFPCYIVFFLDNLGVVLC